MAKPPSAPTVAHHILSVRLDDNDRALLNLLLADVDSKTADKLSAPASDASVVRGLIRSECERRGLQVPPAALEPIVPVPEVRRAGPNVLASAPAPRKR